MVVYGWDGQEGLHCGGVFQAEESQRQKSGACVVRSAPQATNSRYPNGSGHELLIEDWKEGRLPEKGPEVWELKRVLMTAGISVWSSDNGHIISVYVKMYGWKLVYFQVFLKMCFKLPPFTKYSRQFSSHDVYLCFGGNQASFKEVSKVFRWQEVACVCASEITSRRWLSVQFRYLHQLELWLPLSGDSSCLLRGFTLKERRAPGGCFCRAVFRVPVIPNLHIYVSQPLTQVLLSLNFLFFIFLKCTPDMWFLVNNGSASTLTFSPHKITCCVKGRKHAEVGTIFNSSESHLLTT